MRERTDEDVEVRHRETKEEARRRASAERGIELPAPDYVDESGVTDLGVDEPRVPNAPEDQDDD